MLAISLLTTNQAVGGSTPSGRAIQLKQQVREDFAGLFYLLLFFVFPSALKKSMSCELPRPPG